jgi:hypothetical protein
MNVSRWIPLSGVAAVILIGAGFGAAGSTPSEDAPVSKIVAFYSASGIRCTAQPGGAPLPGRPHSGADELN